jgi:NAD(P)H-flavin reductase
VVVITGGLGCAPVVSVIHYVLRRRERFRRLIIMQGVKHADDLIWREQYEAWSRLPDTQVLLAASQGGPLWPWRVGHVPVLFDEAHLNGEESMVMMCGPEGMMCTAIPELRKRGVADENIWLSMERNMQCGVGKCGHCQHGGNFVCKNGPVFALPEVAPLLGVRGF